jgi:uncharacterized protein (TIGR02611 family)
MHPIIVKTKEQVKRFIFVIVGFTFLILGIAMILLPGPAFIMIPLGLGILATEFVWAKVFLNKIKDKFNTITKSARNSETK